MGGRTKERPRGDREEFKRLVAAYSGAADRAQKERARSSIWDRFGVSGAAFISDMANFSATSRTQGICHCLKLIHRMREIVAAAIAANDGTLLKYDADNCFAFFDNTDDAIQTSFDISAELLRTNRGLPPADHVSLSVGIDHGKLLLIGTEDYFGDPVNTASKLGEDLGGGGDILVTERAIAMSSYSADDGVERGVACISEIEIRFLRLSGAAAQP
ncbi:MAG: hypothetical protein BMS9Abin32_213 [Gammaproteobacteria bacterium]|nr:MAG: hypothetical protein BMS9Abin32_213 [Gammaproteobacteria bacterium]